MVGGRQLASSYGHPCGDRAGEGGVVERVVGVRTTALPPAGEDRPGAAGGHRIERLGDAGVDIRVVGRGGGLPLEDPVARPQPAGVGGWPGAEARQPQVAIEIGEAGPQRDRAAAAAVGGDELAGDLAGV